MKGNFDLKQFYKKLIFYLSFILFVRFVNQQQQQVQSSSETSNANYIQLENCPLIADQSMNVNSFDVEPGYTFNYPYATNQPIFVNYHPVATVLPQSPVVYYCFPTEPNVYPNQFIFVDPVTAVSEVEANRQVSVGSVENPSQYAAIQNTDQNQFLVMDVHREIYERYNISYNDAL